MEQSFYWEANPSSASQEIPRILWKLKVHDRTHNSLLDAWYIVKYFVTW